VAFERKSPLCELYMITHPIVTSFSPITKERNRKLSRLSD
jgi:hypothetical protein